MKNKKKQLKNIPLETISDPTFLHELNYKELDLLAENIRQKIIETTSINGGHLSSNLGVVELTIALHRVFDFKTDKLIFDVGHQAYTHKILTGRDISTIRKKDGVASFQKMDESIYDVYEAGHSSTSLSAASAMAIARDLNHEQYNVVALIGDSSIVNGLAFEALNNISHTNHKVIIILNDNEMSISQPVGGMGRFFSKISTGYRYNKMKNQLKHSLYKTRPGQHFFNFLARFKNAVKRKLVPTTVFDNLGLIYSGPYDGHNIKALEKAFRRAKNTNRSVVIHAITTKGKGYKFAESDRTGYWHGVSPFDIQTGAPKVFYRNSVSWSHLFADLTYERMLHDEKTILISPATEKGAGMDRIFHDFKNRAFDVGIAEEHAVVLAGAIALSGYHPIISIYSTFLQRAYDMISHDVARMNEKVTFLVDRAGLVGPDGETHQGIYDIAFLATIPNVTVVMPTTINEAKLLFDYKANKGPLFIRIAREQVSLIDNNEEINNRQIDSPSWFKCSSDPAQKLAIIGVGPNAEKLRFLLKDNHIDSTFYKALFLIPLDCSSLDKLISYDKIIIYNSYGVSSGFADEIKSYLLEHNFRGKLFDFSLPLEYIKQATILEQLTQYELTPDCLIKKVMLISNN